MLSEQQIDQLVARVPRYVDVTVHAAWPPVYGVWDRAEGKVLGERFGSLRDAVVTAWALSVGDATPPEAKGDWIFEVGLGDGDAADRSGEGEDQGDAGGEGDGEAADGDE